MLFALLAVGEKFIDQNPAYGMISGKNFSTVAGKDN
jgi:hypothetical protein